MKQYWKSRGILSEEKSGKPAHHNQNGSVLNVQQPLLKLSPSCTGTTG